MRPTTEPATTGVLVALKRHAFLVVICGLLAGGIAAALLSQREPEYRATSEVLFADPGPEFAVLGTTLPEAADQERRMATNVAVIQSGATLKAAARRLDGVSPEQLRSAAAVAPAGASNVVDIAVTSSSTREAVRRADAYAAAAVAGLRAHERARAGALADRLQARYDDLSRRQRRTGEGTTLRDQLFQLEALASSGSGGQRVVQRADEAVARVDKPEQLIALGIMLGLLVGAGLALLRSRSDRRVRDGEELAAAGEVPVLASVGRSRAIRRGKPFAELPEQDAEVFRFLHGKLRFAGGGAPPPRTVLVTSARDGEGKSSVASYLAAAAATAGARVLLIEADMRRPSLPKWLDAGAGAGLVEVLDGALPMEEAIASTPHGRGVLDVLPAGSTSAEAALLLQSGRMRDLLEQSRTVYDLVIVDTSPLGLVADALPLLSRVDGVLIASLVGLSSAPDVHRLRWQIAEMGGRVLGVVVSKGRANSGYGYTARERRMEVPA